MAVASKGFRPYMGTTAVISLGFFTMGLMDPLYDTFVPLFLRRYIPSMSLVGTIMTIDNWFALFLIPLVALWSDKARTPIGRRMPFIVAALPASAVLFACIPYAALASAGALLAVIVALNVFKQGARGPVVALMPDIIPGDYRSEANGVINMSGALAGIIGTLLLARLIDFDAVLPLIGRTKDKLPFVLAAVLVVVSVALLFAFVRERRAEERSAEERIPLLASLRGLVKAGDRSALLILASIFAWFLGYQGVLPFVSSYMRDVMGVPAGQASLAMGAVAVAMTLCGVPAGYIAHRVGRRRTIRFALLAIVLILLAIFAHEPLAASAGLGPGARLASFLGLMFLFGAFWIAISANSFPMLWQMASFGNIGAYTGLYYAAKESASIVAPPLSGAAADLFGLRAIFLFAAAFFLAAFFVMRGVRSGEAGGGS